MSIDVILQLAFQPATVQEVIDASKEFAHKPSLLARSAEIAKDCQNWRPAQSRRFLAILAILAMSAHALDITDSIPCTTRPKSSISACNCFLPAAVSL